jgi:tetratricopeptide (TPR) repeat protein
MSIEQAISLHRQGRLGEAEPIYRSVLSLTPADFQPLYLLGMLKLQQGDPGEAVRLLTAAIDRRPDAPDALATLAGAFHMLGRHEEALAAFDKVLRGGPNDVEALYNRGVVLSALGREQEAVASYNRALRINPDHAPSRLNRANALAKLKRSADALADYDRFLHAAPNDADALNNRGITLAEMGRDDQALTSFEGALRMAPHHPHAQHNRGRALRKLKRHEEALVAYGKLLALNPRDLSALKGRGAVLLEMKIFEEALRIFDAVLAIDSTDAEAIAFRGAALFGLDRFNDVLTQEETALALNPNDAPALLRKADALRLLGRYIEALEYYEKGLALAPERLDAKAAWADSLMSLGRNDDADRVIEEVLANAPNDDSAKWVKSQLCLARGELDVGWDLYESRWTATLSKAAAMGPPSVQSLWQGQPVESDIMIWGEQGLGDQILHASMVPDLVARGHSIVLEVESRLVGLFARSFCGVKVVPMTGKLYQGPFDAQLPMGSLGQYLRRDWDAFPQRDDGYLRADAEGAARLRARLARHGERLVGLSWRSHNPSAGRLKTALLKDFAALFSLPRCRFIDLQYGDTAEERRAVEDEFGVKIERLDDIDNTIDIDGLAALITACDLVASVSNTNAHLAGALGKPTWVFIPYGHARFWYWFKGKPNSPWYPRVRVKHQASDQSWADAIGAATPEISAFLASRDSSAVQMRDLE